MRIFFQFRRFGFVSASEHVEVLEAFVRAAFEERFRSVIGSV